MSYGDYSEPETVRGRERRVHVVQGEHFVTDDPGVMLTTVLGSCVAACIRDPDVGVGGMNHFLLPGRTDGRDSESVRYGVHAMELLVNGLLRRGARRERLQAKLFGGARLVEGLTDVGAQNSNFAETFLRDEGIRTVGGSLRGEHARRIQFWPVSGRARQLQLGRGETVFETERVAKPVLPIADPGDVELF